MKQFTYKEQDVRMQNGTVEIRRHYPASVHKGFPAEFQPIAQNIATEEEAKQKVDNFLA